MTAYGRHVRHEGCRFRTKWHEVARSWSRHVVLAGSTDQYLAGCWHSQESTNLCTRDDEILATDEDIFGVTVSFLLKPPTPRRFLPVLPVRIAFVVAGSKEEERSTVVGQRLAVDPLRHNEFIRCIFVPDNGATPSFLPPRRGISRGS